MGGYIYLPPINNTLSREFNIFSGAVIDHGFWRDRVNRGKLGNLVAFVQSGGRRF